MAPRDTPTLLQRALWAGGWTLAGQGMGQILRLASNLVMTRILVPEMFGVMAIATMVTVVLWLLSDLGIRQNIVQSDRGDDPAFLDTAWVIQVARGCMQWLVAVILSLVLYTANSAHWLPTESVYAAPVLPWVISVVSLVAVITGFQSTKMAVAQRSLDQKRIIQVELISQVIALAVMIMVGLATKSIWALVAGTLVSSLTATLLSHLWMSGHANRFRVEKRALQELTSFGKWVFASSAIGTLAANGDRLLLGFFANSHTLGLYSIAALIVGAIDGTANRLFGAVSLPMLSATARNDRENLREVYYKIRVPLDLALLFLCGLLISTGQLVIDILYDDRYAGSGGMLRVLAFSLFAVRLGIAHQLYLAVAEPRLLMLVSVTRAISLYALTPALYYLYGTEACIWGIALHGMATVPLTYYFNAKFGLNDFGKEMKVLAALPIGYLLGEGIDFLYRVLVPI